MTPEHMRALLERSWSRDTSATPDIWTPERPSTGQCAVTALLVQEYLGGGILRAPTLDGSHYWNLVDTREVDLTADQFDNSIPPLGDRPEYRTSYDLLANEDTARRWRWLRRCFEDALLHAVDALNNPEIRAEGSRHFAAPEGATDG